MGSFLLFFIFTRNPNKQFPDGDDTESIVWPEYTAHEKEYLVISTNDSSIGRGLRAKQCAFWKNFLPKLINALGKLTHQYQPVFFELIIHKHTEQKT